MALVKNEGNAASPQKRNLLILGAILVVLIVAVVLIAILSTDSDKDKSAKKAPDYVRQEQGPASGSGRDSSSRSARTPRRERPARADRPRASIVVDVDEESLDVAPRAGSLGKDRKLRRAVAEYLTRYDRVVASGDGWSELAQWAGQHDLYVEAYHCARLSGMPVGLAQTTETKVKVHDTKLLVAEGKQDKSRRPPGIKRGGMQEKNWRFVGQKEFENTLAIKGTSSRMFSPKMLVRQLEQLKAGRGSSSMMNAARLMVQVDCLHGQRLYKEMIKQRRFYDYLARALRQSYLAGVPEEQAWMASWYQSPPMNLWLIRQLVNYSPPKAKKASPKAGAKPSGRPFPKRQARGPAKITPAVKHRLLMLRVLARRGGLVSSKLIGELLRSDADGELGRALASGAIPPELFTRFTGVYAAAMVKPLSQALQKHGTQAQAWSAIAAIMCRTINRQAISEVITSAKAKKGPIDGQTAFFLAAGADRYALKNLITFARAGRLTDLDVLTVFDLWTQKTGKAGTGSFWDRLGKFVPFISRKPSPPGPTGTRNMPGQLFLQAGPRSQSQSDRFGRPKRRTFGKMVDAAAAKTFLKSLGALSGSTDKGSLAQPGRSGRPTRVKPGRGRGPGGLPQIRQDAVRVLVSLYDSRLGRYYTALLGASDPRVAELARLALCLINDTDTDKDKGSQEKLLEDFWQQTKSASFGLGRASVSTGTKRKGQKQLKVSAGKISVPLDENGLPDCGISARQALIYFDNRDAAKAFQSVLGKLVTNETAFKDPEAVAEGACEAIEAVGRWQGSKAAGTLEDLIGSTGDFGFRGTGRRGARRGSSSNNHSTRIRRKALEVLGEIGDEAAMGVVVHFARFGQEAPELFTAARVALARRGYPEALDLFVDILEQKDHATKSQGRRANPYKKTLSEIDENLETMTDVALLAVGNTKITDPQADRLLGMVRTLGQSRQQFSRSQSDLQERFVLKLLENGHPKLLRGLGRLIEEASASAAINQPPRGARSSEPYYWNRRTRTGGQDDVFLKMIEALGKCEQFEDEGAVMSFVTALLNRQRQSLITAGSKSARQSKIQLMQFRDAGGSTRNSRSTGLAPGRSAQRPAVVSRGRASRGSGRREQDLQPQGPKLDLPTRQSSQRSSVQYKAVAPAIDLIAALQNAPEYLRDLERSNLFTCHACLARLKLGDDGAANDLAAYLAASTAGPGGTAMQSLALERMEETGGLGLLAVLGGAVKLTAEQTWQLRLADAAVVLTKRLWEEQMAGVGSEFSDQDRIMEISPEWKDLARSKKVSKDLSDRLVIVLAACQADVEVVSQISKLLRQACRSGKAVSEQSAEAAVQIIKELNPSGNKELVQLYKTILTLTVKSTTPGRSSRNKRTYGRSTRSKRRPASASRIRTTSGQAYAYTAIAPMVIEALAAIKLPASVEALAQLTKRSDLLGFIAVAHYRSHPAAGRQVLMLAIKKSRQDPAAARQAVFALPAVATDPSPASAQLLHKAVLLGDISVAEAALEILAEWTKDPAISGSIEMTSTVRMVLRAALVGRRAANASQFARLADKAIAIATPFSSDEEIARMIDQAQRSRDTIKGSSRTGKGPRY